MEKQYIQPTVEELCSLSTMPLCGSQDVRGDGPVNATYGGVDEEGTLDPSTHYRYGYTNNENIEEMEAATAKDGWSNGLW